MPSRVKAPLAMGAGNAGVNTPPLLDISGLPVFTLTCDQVTSQAERMWLLTRSRHHNRQVQVRRQASRLDPAGACFAARFSTTVRPRRLWNDRRFGIGFTDQHTASGVAPYGPTPPRQGGGAQHTCHQRAGPGAFDLVGLVNFPSVSSTKSATLEATPGS
jgi:hypothetical protein